MFYDVEQNTKEWFDLRLGKVTASCMNKVMARQEQVGFTLTAQKYAVQVALERITGRVTKTFTNPHMERGKREEPIARNLYEWETLTEVNNGGFYLEGQVGCSPDGNVAGDGMIEIKSVIEDVHIANINRGSFDPRYKWQLATDLHISERDWIDFVSYCGTFPEDNRLCIYRVHRDMLTDELISLSMRIPLFLELVEVTEKKIRSGSYVSGGKEKN